MNDRDDHLRWKQIDSRLVKRCGIFDLYESKRRAKNHKEGIFHLLDAPDWANVVPVLRDERGRSCFLMVRQYRHGISRTTVEFPAGLIEAGEDPEAAAKRELLEETGYRPGSLEPIGTINPNPAFMNNRCHTFLAEDLCRASGVAGSAGSIGEGEAQSDDLELLETLLVPVDTVVAEIGRGPFCNAMTALALYWYQRWKGNNGQIGADRIRTGA